MPRGSRWVRVSATNRGRPRWAKAYQRRARREGGSRGARGWRTGWAKRWWWREGGRPTARRRRVGAPGGAWGGAFGQAAGVEAAAEGEHPGLTSGGGGFGLGRGRGQGASEGVGQAGRRRAGHPAGLVDPVLASGVLVIGGGGGRRQHGRHDALALSLVGRSGRALHEEEAQLVTRARPPAGGHGEGAHHGGTAVTPGGRSGPGEQGGGGEPAIGLAWHAGDQHGLGLARVATDGDGPVRGTAAPARRRKIRAQEGPQGRRADLGDPGHGLGRHGVGEGLRRG